MSKSTKTFDIVGKYKILFLIPALIIIAGIIVTALLGLNIGIDFEGGAIVNVNFNADLTDAQYEENLAAIVDIIEAKGLKVALKQRAYDEGTVITVRYENIGDETVMNPLNTEVKTAIQERFPELREDSGADNITMETIGKTASNELILRAFISIVAATIVMLIYIGFRFDWKSGIAAIITLIINVLIMLALTAILQIQINTSFIAAVITIIAYSINSTIIIFDRVRENKKIAANLEKVSMKEVANKAVKDSLTRTIFAAFTTLITITVLAIFALPTIREFALPIIFGLVAGIYSSICIAPALWVAFCGEKLITKKASDEVAVK